jgi:hypothetical protein
VSVVFHYSTGSRIEVNDVVRVAHALGEFRVVRIRREAGTCELQGMPGVTINEDPRWLTFVRKHGYGEAWPPRTP